MGLYRWIVEYAVILGLSIDFLALIVTIFLTIAIYKLEQKHERDKELAERHRKELSKCEAAKVFLIDNDEEIEYLPLAQIANNLYPKRKHCRKVITRFLRCDEQLQREILRQVNVPFLNVSMTEVQNVLEKLQIDLKGCGFGKSILYDGGKYLYRALERWAKNSITDVNPYIFEDVKHSEFYQNASEISWRFASCNTTLFSYMYNYLHAEELGLNQENILPPIDMVFQQCNLGNCDEETVTFWTMRIIVDFCQNIMGSRCDIRIDESIIQTQEDMFYYTLLVLCETYAIGEERK